MFKVIGNTFPKFCHNKTNVKKILKRYPFHVKPNNVIIYSDLILYIYIHKEQLLYNIVMYIYGFHILSFSILTHIISFI